MADGEQEGVLQALQQGGQLTAQQVDAATAELQAGKSLEEALVNSGLVEEEVYVKALADALGLPYVVLKGATIPRSILSIIPESTAREHTIIAYNDTDEALQVAMGDPTDRQIIEFIHKKVDKPIEVAVASRSSVLAALAMYQDSLDAELQEIISTTGVVAANTEKNLANAAEDLPVIRITDLYLKHAILQDASDIHIEPTEQEVIIRFRVDGILHDVITLPKNYLAGLVARIKVLSNLKIDEHRLPQDGRFKIENNDYKVAFRVSILPVFDGEKIVMRLLDESGHGLTLDDVGMNAKILEIFRRNIGEPNGMILVTGPTGSGKTTTLYAAMRELNTPEVNISTVEDPIEYRMPRINQTQVNPKIGLTFSNGLRALVRQDPDILMVGEIRDEETASLAVNAALTGHLVLSTLHTNSAAGALPRLLDMKVEAFLLASTVNVLLAQRLVRRLCSECRQEVSFNKERQEQLGDLVNLDDLMATMQEAGALKKSATLDSLKIFEPQEEGCTACTAGYKGRLGIYEIIEFTEDIRALIKPTTSSDQLAEAARQQQGLATMIEDGLMKVMNGTTSIEEILRVAKE